MITSKECVYCGSTTQLVLDHFIPRSVLGSNEQCVRACSICNIKKSNKHPRFWYFNQPFFSEERWQSILAFLGLNEFDVDKAMEFKSSNLQLRSKLPELMKKKGLDQKTVAAQTGLSATTVGKIYRSHFDRIDNHTMKTLLLYFGLRKLDDLIEVVWEEDDIEGVQV